MWGKEVQFLTDVWNATGAKPKALRDRPALQASNGHYLEAFYDLNAGRSYGELPYPIATSDILAYCELMGVARARRPWWFTVLRALDSAYINVMVANNDKERVSDQTAGAGGQKPG